MVACPVCAAAPDPPRVVSPDRLHGTPGRFVVARCPRCGTGMTLPPATFHDLASYYPTGYGAYEARPHPHVRAISSVIQAAQRRAARRRPPLDAIAALPPGRGLDVGCGRGDVAAGLVGDGWRMTGVEPSDVACVVARERGVNARHGVLATVALDPGAYDAAIFQQSLEHTDDPVGDLRRTHAALRPDAVIAVSVPNAGGWQARRFGGRWYHLDLPRHRVHFTASSLARALDEAGFTDVRTSTSTSAVGLLASIQYRLWGRCLFPHGLALRVAAGLCALALPLARLADRLGGGGDLLHATARRPSGSSGK
ncbi:MAG: class I SAM-dependent methyltransferase [Solirubrobacteraceae bacterium MAG38_C4-C5]|nr:class I SAM-dependent methyltransferase [Candidatus Siliceabacter maunaloa]